MKTFSKVVTALLWLVIGLIIGATLGVNAIADWIELDMKPVEAYSSITAPLNGELSAVNYYGSQVQVFAEDDMTPTIVLSDTLSPQVTQHGLFLQSTGNPQPAGLNQ